MAASLTDQAGARVADHNLAASPREFRSGRPAYLTVAESCSISKFAMSPHCWSTDKVFEESSRAGLRRSAGRSSLLAATGVVPVNRAGTRKCLGRRPIETADGLDVPPEKVLCIR